ncbi:unnamed protein product [Spodoptera littoralis]|uniref:Uncharacterized protein n=1 Tax=Spodoptera littoralis TaxID=7109 RepID=A0A9P0N348_SPOLI|nr:unnamed protein product [Spodoptera littoralis]CAH1639773.1 unnamed protein product [Spodoptera littoralis]
MAVLNTFTLCYMIFFLSSQCCFATSVPLSTGTETREATTRGSSFYHNVMTALLQNVNEKSYNNTVKSRYKRDEEGLSSSVMVRLIVKLLKTILFAKADDDDHPLSKARAEPVVSHIKTKFFGPMFE